MGAREEDTGSRGELLGPIGIQSGSMRVFAVNRSRGEGLGPAARRRLGGWIVLATIVILLGACKESRASRLADRAETLARAGHYDEAIAMLEKVQDRYGGTRAAARSRKMLILFKGLREADLKEDRRRAKDDLTALGRALYDYNVAHRRYPATLGELPGSDSLPLVDPWGNDYRYVTWSEGRRYRLECLGRDGAKGGEGDDRDLRIENGEFVLDLPWLDR
jgi:hypothetical protein